MYFSEVDVRSDRIASIQSAEDISSGYSSGEGLYPGQPLKLLAREGLQRTGSLTRSRTTRVTRSSVPKKGVSCDVSNINLNKITLFRKVILSHIGYSISVFISQYS